MNQAHGEEAIANADKANDRYLASLRNLEEWQSSDEGLLQDSNGQSSPNENQDAVPVIDTVLIAAKDAKVAEEIAIRLNFHRLAQQKRIRESHRVWNEQIRKYEAQRFRILSGTSPTQVVASARSDQNPQSFPSEIVSQSISDQSSEVNSVAGNFCLVGGLLVAIGSFLPYVVAVSSSGLSISRNAYQFGQNLSMTYEGPLILLTGLFMIYRGLVLRGVFDQIKPGEWTPLWSSVIAAAVVLDAWLASFPSSTGVTFNHGYGGIVSLVGALCGFTAVYLRRKTAKTGTPLTE